MLGLLLGCGLRSEVVGLRLDQLQLRESHRPGEAFGVAVFTALLVVHVKRLGFGRGSLNHTIVV